MKLKKLSKIKASAKEDKRFENIIGKTKWS